MKNIKTVVGYCRVSTELQREKESIKTQEELIRKFCQDNGLKLVGIIKDDGVSGTIPFAERIGGNEIFERARRGEFDAVVVYKTDRIGRDSMVNQTVVHELYKVLGVQILGVAQSIDLTTPMGRAMFSFQSTIGEMERESTIQSSKDATLRLAKEGLWLGGIVPFGYRVAGKKREARLVISEDVIPDSDKSEADIVQMIYDMIGNQGCSTLQVAKQLNALGVPTCYMRDGRVVGDNKRKKNTSGEWRPGRVRNMVVEKTYMGIHEWGKRGSKRRPKGQKPEPIERPVPAIVAPELWYRAQETLKRNRMIPLDAEVRKYLLRGLMKCVICGKTYVGTASKGRSVERLTPEEAATAEVSQGRVLRRYYVCNSKNSAHYGKGSYGQGCCSRGLRAQELEESVWADVEQFLRHPGDTLNLLQQKVQETLVNTQALEAELAKLEKQVEAQKKEINNLCRMLRQERITDEEFDEQKAEVDANIKTVLEQLEWKKENMVKARSANDSLASAETLLTKLKTTLQGELSWETKRAIVEALIESIEVIDTVEPGEPLPKYPRVKVTYLFGEPSLLPDFDRANIGTDVRAVSC